MLREPLVPGSGIEPNMAVICDVTFATDHPGIDTNKHGEVFLDKGPALGIGPAAVIYAFSS